jgi:DNA repair photolyase
MITSLHEFAPPPGRGTPGNPGNRFESMHVEVDGETMDDLLASEGHGAPSRPLTTIHRDFSRSIISRNESPDLRFHASLNPYRGCEHGCAYCYARPYHEYLGFSAGLDFETRLMVKEDAPALLRKELSAPAWAPQPLACSGITDCYQPVEKRLGITRSCLQVLLDFRNPVAVITKNHLVTRDADLLTGLAAHQAASVLLSLTSLDPGLARRMEPRAASPGFRLQAIRDLADAGVPVGVSVAPVIPGLNDHEIPGILDAARSHGASFAAFSLLRLPHGVADLFLKWLDLHYPGRRHSVETRLRAMHGGELHQGRFGQRMRGSGPEARLLENLFATSCRRIGLAPRSPELSITSFRRADQGQLWLF